MPKSLADGHTKVIILATKPTNPLAPTVAELTAGIDASCAILSSDFNLGAVASEKLSEKALCQEGNIEVLGQSNYAANLSLFRYFTAGHVSDATADQAYQALKVKGTTVWLFKRFTSRKSTDAVVALDECEVYEVETDNAFDTDRQGYIKRTIPLTVQAGYLNGVVGA